MNPNLAKHEIFWVCSIILLLSGCIDTFNREMVLNQTIQVGDYEIEESIYSIDEWPDPRFERLYSVTVQGETTHIGQFEDESGVGIFYEPILLNDTLIIFSSAHVFLWRPEEEPRHFNPYEAEGWAEYSKVYPLNGHYDYAAQSSWINGDQWLIQYQCIWCHPAKPVTLLFYSVDDGASFDICVERSTDLLSCED